MNRYDYASEIVYCDLCGKNEAVRWRMCEVCVGAYITYYNFMLKNKRDPQQPLSPDNYIRYKNTLKDIQAAREKHDEA